MGFFSSKAYTDIKNRVRSIFINKYSKANLNWIKIRYLKYFFYDKPGVHSLGERKVFFNTGQELLYSLREIFVEDIYKIKFNTFEPFILDCGANIGLSVLYMKRLYPSARIIAFEPDTVNYGLLEKNVTSLKGVEIIQNAVWKENTILKFDQAGTLGSRIAAGDTKTSFSEVQATRLNDYLNQPVDFLKLDIEGAEYEVLMDCAGNLKRVENMFIEYHGHFHNINELNEILALLEKNNFHYYIKEASSVYPTPFYREGDHPYDIQLNIFCFKN